MTDTFKYAPHSPAIDYCTEQVRLFDHDRFLCGLFAPTQDRAALFALFAFNIEVAKIRENVSEPTLGILRLQWWHEALESLKQGQVRQHLVLQALAEIESSHPFSTEPLVTILRAREADVEGVPPTTLDALEQYARETSSNLLLLALEMLKVTDDNARAAAMHMGIGWALVGILRSAPIHFRQGILQFPSTLMHTHDMQPDRLGSPEFLVASEKVVKIITDAAEAHLKEARRISKSLPKATREKAMSVLLFGVLADFYVKRIQKNRYQLFTKNIEGNRLSLQLRLLKSASFRGF